MSSRPHARAATEPSPSERRRLRLAALAELARALARPLDLDELVRALYRGVASAVDASIFMVGLYDEPSQTVTIVRQIYGGDERAGGSFPLGTGFTSQVIRTGQPSLIRHWAEEGPHVNLRYASRDSGVLPESGLTVPLLWRDRAVGVLLVQSYRPEAYDDEDLAWLEAVAGQAALALEHLRHHERRDAQLQQRLSELEATLAAMADALLIVDADGAIARLNPAARDLLCTDGATVVLGQPLDAQGWDRWPLAAREIAEALAPMVEAVRGGEARRDVEVELRAGARRVLSLSCSPLPGQDGRPGGGVIVFRDITSRREIERLKDEVLSIASHDLKTPIAGIRARVQLLERKARRGAMTLDEVVAGLPAIEQQADRLTSMLNLLLDFSRVEAGRFELIASLCDLVDLANRVVDSIRPTTDRHQIVVRAPPKVIGEWDERRLDQVLQNLIANAVKYSPGGGTVELAIEPTEPDVLVSVHDHGLGLAEEELPRVFQRFYRTGATRRLEGSGLGLYISQAIVSAHGGRIWAESAGPGHGSTFAFRIPWRAPSA